MASLSNFPLQPAVAKARILDLCRAGKIRIPPGPGGGWEQAVTTRQVLLCLEKGEIVGTGRRNEHGHYQFRMRRFSAGVAVLVDLVLYVENEEWAAQILEVNHE